jgi:tetratricopeptide (TPR) repeat protein
MFLLLKISERDILRINQWIINLCHESLVKKQADELEYYALEHLSTHLFLTAMNSQETGVALKKLAYDTTHWDRQIELSKGFDWSKKMLNAMLQWAMKWDHNQILECALCKVDLHYLEQNDAQKIVALVVNGEIEVALSRIETFGGADEEGLKRKFILYMLCLMEITLFNGKEKPFRKTAIEKLLNHLDEQIPAGVLDWNNFFPSYLMFQMACEWAELGLDYLIVYKRTDDWEKDWIIEKGPYNAIAMQVLKKCAHGISDDYERNSALMYFAVELGKQGQIKKSLAIARGISYEYLKISALAVIAVELSNHGQVQEALAIARGISHEGQKSRALKNIAAELSKQGQVEDSAVVMKEALDIARATSDDYWKSSALSDIAVELSKQGQVQEALTTARAISEKDRKITAFKNIAVELSKQGQVQEALAIARGISDDHEKISVLKNICVELSKQGQVEVSAAIMQEALAISNCISAGYWKGSALANIAAELFKMGKVKEALAIARGITHEGQKCRALKNIAVEFSKQEDWTAAENTGLEIPQITKRHDCWREFAVETVKVSAWQKALESVTRLQSQEAQLFYLKGWAKEINQMDVNGDCLVRALPMLSEDSGSIETLLQKYAVREVAFGNPSKELTARLNRTLNIQWFLDIKNSNSAI